MILAHEPGRRSQVVVLHWAGIVVQQSQRVARLDEEVVVDAPVLEVVDDGGQVAGKELGEV